MQEIGKLAHSFDERIMLSAEALYTRFGKENGEALLAPYFRHTEWIPYEDSLLITDPEPLILYILSCHGNQNQYLGERFADFKALVKKKTARGFRVTKDSGIFLSYN